MIEISLIKVLRLAYINFERSEILLHLRASLHITFRMTQIYDTVTLYVFQPGSLIVQKYVYFEHTCLVLVNKSQNINAAHFSEIHRFYLW